MSIAPPAGIEPAAYRLGGGRSIRLSYGGESGTPCRVLPLVTLLCRVEGTWGAVGPERGLLLDVEHPPRKAGAPEGDERPPPPLMGRLLVAVDPGIGRWRATYLVPSEPIPKDLPTALGSTPGQAYPQGLKSPGHW